MINFNVLWVILLGLAVGSFLNVVIYRLPRKIMLKKSRSACPKCGIQLRWYHNIPLISYIFLLGKCAYCKEPISVRYPLVELFNAGLYLYFYLTFDISTCGNFFNIIRAEFKAPGYPGH